MTDLANEHGDGWRVPRPDGSISPNVSEEDRQWLMELGGMQPLKTLTEKVRIDGNHLKIAEKVYVLCTERKETPFYQFADWTRQQKDWQTVELPTHHHLLMSMPQETADIIMGKA